MPGALQPYLVSMLLLFEFSTLNGILAFPWAYLSIQDLINRSRRHHRPGFAMYLAARLLGKLLVVLPREDDL
jgi:hypothetical protein